MRRLPPLPRAGADWQLVGQGVAVLAYLLFAMQDATIKWLVAALPVWQILFCRSAVLVFGCLATGGRPLVRRVAQTRIGHLIVLRGAVTLAAWVCYFTAARDLPLGELTTLWFTAPVVVALLAAPLLGERVGPGRWVAIAAGFAGAVVIAAPADMALSAPAALVLAGAALWGLGVVLTRRIARQEPSLVQMLANNVFFLFATGIGSALTWHDISANQAALLALVSLFGGLGQYCMFESARLAPASLVAPMEYTALVWAFALGFIVWGDQPPPHVYSGAALIMLAGIVLMATEWTRRQNATRALAGGYPQPVRPS